MTITFLLKDVSILLCASQEKDLAALSVYSFILFLSKLARTIINELTAGV
jgi:hypothetical protein